MWYGYGYDVGDKGIGISDLISVIPVQLRSLFSAKQLRPDPVATLSLQSFCIRSN